MSGDNIANQAGFETWGRRLRLGFVGGGKGAMIGTIQATGARITNRWEVVAGALSARPEVAVESGRAWHLAEDRIYTDYREMAAKEKQRPDGIDAVCVVTPNDKHHAMCCTFLDAGYDVICDKPLTTTLDDAIDLVRRVRKAGVVFGVTHAFAANAMVRQMRDMVAAGAVGRIRQIHVAYFDEFLAFPGAEETKQFSWRIDPAQSGAASTAADIGTHAWHLSTFVSGLEMQQVRAEFHTCSRPKPMEDTAFMHVRFAGGVPGTLNVTQVAAGERGGLHLRIYGDDGRLEWLQSESEKLRYTRLGEAEQIITRGVGGSMADSTQRYVTLPRGYAEGWFEAWANLYAEFAVAIAARRDGRTLPAGHVAFPTVEDGARGIKFVTAAVKSNAEGGSWQDCTLDLSAL
ncbi:MAG: Gfo/Idh/MocA family oxidoreductase [Alphaproteobacteria bacterium]